MYIKEYITNKKQTVSGIGCIPHLQFHTAASLGKVVTRNCLGGLMCIIDE